MHAKLDEGDGHHVLFASKPRTWQSLLFHLEPCCQTKANSALSFRCLIECQTIGAVPVPLVDNVHL